MTTLELFPGNLEASFALVWEWSPPGHLESEGGAVRALGVAAGVPGGSWPLCFLGGCWRFRV